MHSDKQKKEFALLWDEDIFFNTVSNKLNEIGFSSIDADTLLVMKIYIHIEFLKYEDKIYFLRSVKKSQTVAPDYIVSDVFYINKPVNKIPLNFIKCHSFVIFLSVIFYYVIVLSIPKMSYMQFR